MLKKILLALVTTLVLTQGEAPAQCAGGRCGVGAARAILARGVDRRQSRRAARRGE